MNRRMRTLAICLVLLGSAAMQFAAAAKSIATASVAESLVVVTEGGALRGLLGNGVREFKGIPYAAPPIKALRWSPPQAPVPWDGVRDATQFRSACPQVVRFKLTEASDDEDCLYLNVATPAVPQHNKKRRPVIVWIHGGAWVGGGANLYPLDYLARRGDLVVVSINYRLGALGFIPHPAFAASDNGAYGFEDQRQALRWVKRNIAAFGGDPGNVTIAGESAGAASVCMQLFAPEQSTGLFHKAIIQSAGCTFRLRSVAENYKTGLALAMRVGCNDAASALACLRNKSVPELLAAQTDMAATDARAFAPSYGSAALPRDGAVALAAGEFVRVPIINGGTSHEMRLYVGYEVDAGQNVTADNYLLRLSALYGDNAAAVMQQYPLTAYSSPPTALGTAMSDFMPGGGLSNCLFLRTARLASRFVPVFQYEFADGAAPPVMPDPGFELGAVHSSELPYFFPRFSNKSVFDGPDLTAPSQQLAAQMVDYWSRFARSGSPGGVGSAGWHRFKTATAVLRLQPGALREYDADTAHLCAFWEKMYPDELSP